MSAQREQVRVYADGLGKSLIQHRPKNALRFAWLGVTYERRRRRDALGLPIFEPAAVQSWSARRPALANPDAMPMLVVALVGTVTLFAVSFLLSYTGLAEAAGWARVPVGLSWAVPVTMDGSILVYTIAAWVFRARGESARLAWGARALFAVLSVVANSVHAWSDSPAALRTALGMVIAGLAPMAVVLTTHTIGRLTIAPPDTAVADAVFEPEPPRADIVEITAVALVEAPDAGPEDRDARMVALRAENLSYAAIAETVGVSKTTVSGVLDCTAAAVRDGGCDAGRRDEGRRDRSRFKLRFGVYSPRVH